MTDEPKSKPDQGPSADSRGAAASAPARDARAERLAAQLKANLRRRKDQARGRAAADKDEPS